MKSIVHKFFFTSCSGEADRRFGEQALGGWGTDLGVTSRRPRPHGAGSTVLRTAFSWASYLFAREQHIDTKPRAAPAFDSAEHASPPRFYFTVKKRERKLRLKGNERQVASGRRG